MMGSNQAIAASNFGAIGLDLGVVGRIARWLLGMAMIAGILYDLAASNPPAMFLAEAAGYFVVSLVAYTVAFYALRGRILAFDLREEPDAVRLLVTASEARAAADTLFRQFVAAADAGSGSPSHVISE